MTIIPEYLPVLPVHKVKWTSNYRLVKPNATHEDLYLQRQVQYSNGTLEWENVETALLVGKKDD